MKAGNITIVMSAIEMKCPLCRFTCNRKIDYFKFRSRYNLRKHLNKEHTDEEIEKYVNKIL